MGSQQFSGDLAGEWWWKMVVVVVWKYRWREWEQRGAYKRKQKNEKKEGKSEPAKEEISGS